MMARRGVLLAALAAAIGCGAPAAPDIPELGDGSLQLFGVLTADSSLQVVYVHQTDGHPIEQLEGSLDEVTATGDVPLAAARAVGRGTEFVLLFDALIRPGRRYRVTVRSPGRPVAMASTTVPGDFSIDSVATSGDPPGTGGFAASWSASANAFRYIVNVRAEPDCLSNAPVCEDIGVPWAGVTSVARIDTVMPGSMAPPDRTRAIEVAVYAVNRELYDYFTTGVGGTFTVQPKQNVAGGYGVIGAWVRRERSIER